MLEFLQRIFVGHAHQYVTKGNVKYEASDTHPTRFVYILECKHCGKIKSTTVAP